MDCWSSLTVSPRDTLFLKFTLLSLYSCTTGFVKLYEGGRRARHLIATYCSPVHAVTVHTHDVHIHFVGGESNDHRKGFKLKFLFNRWIIQASCAGGQWPLNGQCYEYGGPQVMTWMQASSICKSKGATLVSLNSGAEWLAVMETLEFYWNGGIPDVFVGLRTFSYSGMLMYRQQAQWQDNTTAFVTFNTNWQLGSTNLQRICHIYSARLQKMLHWFCDAEKTDVFYLCEFNPPRSHHQSMHRAGAIHLHITHTLNSTAMVVCPSAHLVHNFLACDPLSHCWNIHHCPRQPTSCCRPPGLVAPPSFTCDNQVQHVPYTFVCDHRNHCGDKSDEHFCDFPPCPLHESFDCGDFQCIPTSEECDGIQQCPNAEDEAECFWKVTVNTPFAFQSAMWLRSIVFLRKGALITHEYRTFRDKPANRTCPFTHFSCPGEALLCLPVYLRCNSVDDCPGHEDEVACSGSIVCPGYYRCRGSPVCVHTDHLCDGVPQCPQLEDELLCGFRCPQGCSCYGMAFYCNVTFTAADFQDLRYLEARGSGLSPRDVKNNTMLIYLSLADCGLSTFRAPRLPNLMTLDLSDNRLAHFRPDSLQDADLLRELRLSGNPLHVMLAVPVIVQLQQLSVLDLSRVALSVLDPRVFSQLRHLVNLNLSASGLDHVRGAGFQPLTSLHTLDLSGCPMTHFPRGVFEGLHTLRVVAVSNPKLCCPSVLPQHFDPAWCTSSVAAGLLSSCQDLLRSHFYRVVLFLLAALALVGNVTSFLFRVLLEKRTRSLGFTVFVLHLCVSDFLMGVYLLILGLADGLYRGDYMWKDISWRHSAACTSAGFLSFLSSEVSTFLICIITLDRFLVLRFPFSHMHFSPRSAQVASCVAWLTGVTMAAVPLTPAVRDWHFFSQSGTCIPLLTARHGFRGQGYSFGVFICLNCVLFLFIAGGQGFIYWSVNQNAMSGVGGMSSGRSKDLVIARRLITVAVSDFLCWFPIGGVGVLSQSGVPVPGEVGVALAVLVLPLNSALNPFLYTANLILERRRRLYEDRLMALLSQLQEAP